MPDVTRPQKTTPTRRNRLPVGAVLAALALLAWAGRIAAEPPDDQPELQAAAANKPVLTMDQRTDVGAASLFMGGFPTGTEGLDELALLSAGEYHRFWTFWDPNVVRAVAPEVLAHVKDRTVLTQEIGDQEQDAYFWMLFYANRTSPRALDEAAKKNNVDWVHLFQGPRDYRGDVVHFDGKLVRLRQFDPQPMAAQAGVKNYYEGCMFVDLQENDPLFFVITELPKGLEPGDHLDKRVGFSGYFFKIFRYTAGDTKKTKMDRLAPLCIGRTLTLAPAAVAEEAPADPSWATWLGPAFFGVIGVTVALLFAVGYWFRRSDRRVRGRLTAIRHPEFINPPPEEGPGAGGNPPNTET